MAKEKLASNMKRESNINKIGERMGSLINLSF